MWVITGVGQWRGVGIKGGIENIELQKESRNYVWRSWDYGEFKSQSSPTTSNRVLSLLCTNRVPFLYSACHSISASQSGPSVCSTHPRECTPLICICCRPHFVSSRATCGFGGICDEACCFLVYWGKRRSEKLVKSATKLFQGHVLFVVTNQGRLFGNQWFRLYTIILHVRHLYFT